MYNYIYVVNYYPSLLLLSGLDFLIPCSLESLRDSISGHWSCNPNSDTFNLALLSQYSEETAILRSDIMVSH